MGFTVTPHGLKVKAFPPCFWRKTDSGRTYSNHLRFPLVFLSFFNVLGRTDLSVTHSFTLSFKQPLLNLDLRHKLDIQTLLSGRKKGKREHLVSASHLCAQRGLERQMYTNWRSHSSHGTRSTAQGTQSVMRGVGWVQSNRGNHFTSCAKV